MTIHTLAFTTPTPAEIKSARVSAGWTQIQAAKSVGIAVSPAAPTRGEISRTWQAYEQGERDMPVGTWALFLLVVDQHNDYRLDKKK